MKIYLQIRRYFRYFLCVTGLMLILGQNTIGQNTIGQNKANTEASTDQPLFSFGLIADIQYADAPTAGLRNYRGSLQKLKNGVENINEKNPDFVITLGDNIDRDYESFDKVMPLLSQIKAPVYNAIGNHDFTVEDQFKPLVRKRLNNPRGYFSFSKSHYKFIILDGSDWSTLAHKKGTQAYKEGLDELSALRNSEANNAHDWNGGIGKVQMKWLDKQLGMADEAGEQVLLFCHWPLWPENGTQLWNNQEVMELLETHPSVVAWISGHHHPGGYHHHNGIHYLTIKGMVESKTNTSLGIIDVYRNYLILNGYGDQQDMAMSSGTDQPDNQKASEPYYNLRSGIHNSYYKFEEEKKGRVAFLGGSITHNHGWRDSIMQYLERRFPATDFDFVSAGIPSMGSTPGAFRLERDVLMNGPVDLLFEEAAVNDATNGRSSTEQIRGMEGIVRHMRDANPSADIVIMHFVDPDKMAAYRAGKIPQVIQNHEKVAAHYNIPTLNLAEEITDRIDAGEFTWEGDFKNLHPSPFGQGIYSNSMIAFLESAWKEAEKREKEITTYDLPEKMDPYSYDKGQLIEVHRDMEAKGWTYDDNWTPGDEAGTRANYTRVPMLTGHNPGQTLKFRFSGRAVGVAVAAGPDAGTIQYRIDNGKWKKQSLFTRWSSGLHLPWYYTLASELHEGNHLLELRLAEDHHPDSLGNACRIRYFYINR